MIATPEDAPDVHPASLVTVKVYVPAESPDTVVLVPVPVIVPPGVLVSVQVPEGGRPLSTTLPVEKLQVG